MALDMNYALTAVARDAWGRDDLIVQLDPPCVYMDTDDGVQYEEFDPFELVKPHPLFKESPEARVAVAMDKAIERLITNSHPERAEQ